MQLQSVVWEEDDGLASVRAVIDGQDAIIVHEQNAPRAGYVILFPPDVWTEALGQVTIPEDMGIKRPEMTFSGATNQPDIVKLWWDMHEALTLDQFTPGPRPVTQAKLVKAYAVRKSALPLQNVIVSQARLADLLNMAMLQTALEITDDDARQLWQLQDKAPREVLDKLYLPDIRDELVLVLRAMYSEAQPIVWLRIFEHAKKLRVVHQTAMTPPLVFEMTPDEQALRKHAELLMQRLDYGTARFVGGVLAAASEWSADVTAQVHQQLVVGDGSTVAAERVKNAVQTETTWIMERFAHDLFEVSGVHQKTWQLFPAGEMRCAMCVVNKEFDAPLGYQYESELDEGTPHPPASIGCQCQLLPGYSDLQQLVQTLISKADAQTTYRVSLQMSDAAAEIIGGVEEPWFVVGEVGAKAVGDLQASVKGLGHLLPPVQAWLTGETGQEGDKDVAYIALEPDWLAILQATLQTAGLQFTSHSQFWVVCGPAGQSGLEWNLKFGGPWVSNRIHFSWTDVETGATKAVQISTQK